MPHPDARLGERPLLSVPRIIGPTAQAVRSVWPVMSPSPSVESSLGAGQ